MSWTKKIFLGLFFISMTSIVIFIPQMAFSQTIGEAKTFVKPLGIVNQTITHNTTSTSSPELKAVYLAPKTISKLNQYNNSTVSSSEQKLVNSTLPCSTCQKPWVSIPSWIKNNAKWWSEGQVADSDFLKGIEYLVQNNIINVVTTPGEKIASSNTIPPWIKNNAKWWSDGVIPDSEFFKGIQYMVQNGLIQIHNQISCCVQSSGQSNKAENEPSGIAIYNGNIYVTYKNNIETFDSYGNHISQFGSAGSGPGQFNNPQGIAIDISGHIYVVDSNNNRIERFDSSGNFQSQFGTSGSISGQFNNPQGIVVDNTGHIYVVDTGNLRIEKFDSIGNFLSQFG